MKSIVFTKVLDSVSDDYRPKPSSSVLPDWYKKTDSYFGGTKKDLGINGETNGSIKRCVPVFDALTAGYIIPTYCDLVVKKDINGQHSYTPSVPDSINFHDIWQAVYHPKMNNQKFPKWANPWGIKTPKGYSCLFVPPVHGVNNIFTVVEGIVDTDNYRAPVNFPFVLNDVNFEGLIPAGTPMVQVIPFKRESWQHSIGTEKDAKYIKEDNDRLSSNFFDRYRNMFWERKSFK
jgi:hypothetical protein